MAKCEAELKGTKLRVHCLTARGAVGLPVSYLALSLLMVGVGLYYFNSEYLVGVVVFGFFSVFFSAMAVYRLYKTITAVQYAALRPAGTVDFAYIGFGKPGEETEQVKAKKETSINVLAGTFEYDLENCWMLVQIPSDIEVIGETALENLRVSEYPEYTVISLRHDFVPKGVAFGVALEVVPKKIGEYTITVVIYAKGIYKVRKKLTLKVVK